MSPTDLDYRQESGPLQRACSPLWEQRVAAWREGLRKKRGPRKKECVDLGLEVIAAISPPGVKWTLRDIADVCQCSVGLVREIEQRALRKLRQTANDPSSATAGTCDAERKGNNE